MSATTTGWPSNSILRIRCPGMGRIFGVVPVEVSGRWESSVFSHAEDQALSPLTEVFGDDEPVRDVLSRANTARSGRECEARGLDKDEGDPATMGRWRRSGRSTA
jgi:hypothetical protein